MSVRGIVLLWGSLLLVGCADLPAASSEKDQAAKLFIPAVGRANIYVARSGNGPGGSDSFDLKFDGVKVCRLAASTYFVISAEPGPHEVSVSLYGITSSATLLAVAGNNYFFEVTARPGFIGAEPVLKVVMLPSLGKFMVRQNQLAKSFEP